MRISLLVAAALAASFSAAPALADNYRSGDAAPAMERLSSPQSSTGASFGFGTTPSETGFGVSPRSDRDGDAAPVSRIVNPGSVSGGSFGITAPEAGKHGHFNSPRFD